MNGEQLLRRKSFDRGSGLLARGGSAPVQNGLHVRGKFYIIRGRWYMLPS